MILATAEWCTNCTPVKKHIEDNKLDVQILDVDKDMDLAMKYGVRGLPALIIDNRVEVTGTAPILEFLRNK